ncbi:MAG: uroporphyrinogen-III synthase [Thermoanaerobaculia bacterium]
MTSLSALVVYSGGKPPDFEEGFAALGFAARCVPSHRIEITSETFPLGTKVDRLLFTSRNAVEAFLGSGPDLYSNAKVNAVGAATLDALRRIGKTGEIPAVESVKGLLESLPERLDGELVFWPRAEDADLAPAEELRRRGASIYAPAIYRKLQLRCPEELSEEVQAGKYAAVACTSGAAARWLYQHVEPEHVPTLSSIPAAVLGGKTADVLRKLGATRVETSAAASFASLASKLIELLQEAQRSKT